jgi:PPIC-type PPIASE domain
VKWFIVLLVLLGGGLAAAAFAVPTNAAVVNGSAISQESLNSDVTAIANSADYQCYLNSQAYYSSGGGQLPPVTGAGTGQNPGDNPTATTAFAATYLDTEIRNEIALQLADRHHVTVTEGDLAAARTALINEISGVIGEVAQTAQGDNPHYTCSVTGQQPVSGHDVLTSMPASFVDQQVQFDATVTALQEDLAGIGSSNADLQRYFESHSSRFDTACFTVAPYQSEADAKAAAAQVASGTPFSQVASQAQGGPQGCSVLSEIVAELPSGSNLGSLPTGTVSAPIDDNGTYLLVQITSRTPTPFAKAQASVAEAVQAVGARATEAALSAAERHASVTVDPRYGAWVPEQQVIALPFTPKPSDVLNAPANEAQVASASASASTSPFSG